MNFVTGIATVVVLSFASTAFAEQPSASSEVPRVVALADVGATRSAPTVESLEAYAGCYAAEDGEAFVIAQDGDALTLEAPEAWGERSLTLRQHDATTFVAVDAAVRVEFLRDGRGSIVGASLSGAEGETVAGARLTRRGSVTIEDPESAALAHVPRGVVTIYDVPEGTDASSVLAFSN